MVVNITTDFTMKKLVSYDARIMLESIVNENSLITIKNYASTYLTNKDIPKEDCSPFNLYLLGLIKIFDDYYELPDKKLNLVDFVIYTTYYIKKAENKVAKNRVISDKKIANDLTTNLLNNYSFEPHINSKIIYACEFLSFLLNHSSIEFHSFENEIITNIKNTAFSFNSISVNKNSLDTTSEIEIINFLSKNKSKDSLFQYYTNILQDKTGDTSTLIYYLLKISTLKNTFDYYEKNISMLKPFFNSTNITEDFIEKCISKTECRISEVVVLHHSARDDKFLEEDELQW